MMTPYAPVPDPFPGKGPIPAGAPGFYDREEEFSNVCSLLRAGECVSLVGERKAGKTSFLNYLLTHLPGDEFIPVFIDAQGILPKTDKLFLGSTAKESAKAIAETLGFPKSMSINTLSTPPDQVYLTFQTDLNNLRTQLYNPNGKKHCVVWLIDEIEILQGFKETGLFSFLRYLAQNETDFRMLVAGYDVLYTLSSHSQWPPFFNAFRHITLESLNPMVAQQMIDDAMAIMETTIDQDMCEQILNWTGKKPFFLKWVLSEMAEALNQQEIDRHIDLNILETAKGLFLAKQDLCHHFTHLWNSHTTERQQTVLSLVASLSGPYNHSTILNDLSEKKLVTGDKQASQHLIEDLNRLMELGFLYKRDENYTFTSGCLQSWIKENKPL